MLAVASKYPSRVYVHGGSGLFGLFQNIVKKSANSALAKKVINSATKENFKKAANSALGKQLQSGIVSGTSKAAEKAAETALTKLGLPPLKQTTGEKRKKNTKRNISRKKKNLGSGIIFD